jgi:hypothetical protein
MGHYWGVRAASGDWRQMRRHEHELRPRDLTANYRSYRARFDQFFGVSSQWGDAAGIWKTDRGGSTGLEQSALATRAK